MGISVFIVTDIDAIRRTIKKLHESDSNDEVEKIKQQLFECAQNLVDAGEFEAQINKGYAEKLASGYRWKKIFDKLERLFIALTEDNDWDDEMLGCLEKLLLQRQEDALKKALRSDNEDIVKFRLQLVNMLLENNVLLLNGEIEDYYPDGSSKKIESAVEFNPDLYDKKELCACFTPIGDCTDMEIFFTRVFDV